MRISVIINNNNKNASKIKLLEYNLIKFNINNTN